MEKQNTQINIEGKAFPLACPSQSSQVLPDLSELTPRSAGTSAKKAKKNDIAKVEGKTTSKHTKVAPRKQPALKKRSRSRSVNRNRSKSKKRSQSRNTATKSK